MLFCIILDSLILNTSNNFTNSGLTDDVMTERQTMDERTTPHGTAVKVTFAEVRGDVIWKLEISTITTNVQ